MGRTCGPPIGSFPSAADGEIRVSATGDVLGLSAQPSINTATSNRREIKQMPPMPVLWVVLFFMGVPSFEAYLSNDFIALLVSRRRKFCDESGLCVASNR